MSPTGAKSLVWSKEKRHSFIYWTNAYATSTAISESSRLLHQLVVGYNCASEILHNSFPERKRVFNKKKKTTFPDNMSTMHFLFWASLPFLKLLPVRGFSVFRRENQSNLFWNILFYLKIYSNKACYISSYSKLIFLTIEINYKNTWILYVDCNGSWIRLNLVLFSLKILNRTFTKKEKISSMK